MKNISEENDISLVYDRLGELTVSIFYIQNERLRRSFEESITPSDSRRLKRFLQKFKHELYLSFKLVQKKKICKIKEDFYTLKGIYDFDKMLVDDILLKKFVDEILHIFTGASYHALKLKMRELDLSIKNLKNGIKEEELLHSCDMRRRDIEILLDTAKEYNVNFIELVGEDKVSEWSLFLDKVLSENEERKKEANHYA